MHHTPNSTQRSSNFLPIVCIVDRNQRPSASASQALVQPLGEVWVLKKGQDSNASGRQHVSFIGQDHGGWLGVAPILQTAINDQRCGVISIYASGRFLDNFKAKYSESFSRLGDTGVHPACCYLDLLPVQCGNPDKVIATVGNNIGAEVVGLSYAKRCFGAKGLYFVVDGWAGMGRVFSGPLNDLSVMRTNLQGQIDRIFVNDSLARAMAFHNCPGFSSKQILASGTGQTDSIQPGNVQALRESALRKLGLQETDRVFLFLGDITGGYSHLSIGRDFNIQTFKLCLEAIIQAANNKKDQKFVLLYRPHPSDKDAALIDQEVNRLNRGEYANLSVIKASRSENISVDEAVCASCGCLSIQSTESFRAPNLGRRGVFLAFEGLGRTIIEHYAAPGVLNIISDSHQYALVNRVEQLAKLMENGEWGARSGFDASRNGCSTIWEEVIR